MAQKQAEVRFGSGPVWVWSGLGLVESLVGVLGEKKFDIQPDVCCNVAVATLFSQNA